MTCQADNCPDQPAANELLCARHWSLIPKLWQDRWLVALKDRRGSKDLPVREKTRILKWEFHCESCLIAIANRLGVAAAVPAAVRTSSSPRGAK
jgi:hypothetical protein